MRWRFGRKRFGWYDDNSTSGTSARDKTLVGRRCRVYTPSSVLLISWKG